MRAGTKVWPGSVVVAMLGALAALGAPLAGALAASDDTKNLPKKFKFLGVEVERDIGVYLVTRDVNIRAKPLTKSKRVGRYKMGERIDVVGRAPGAWVAVREDGKDKGFVYEPILLPLIDGTLERDLTGKLVAKGSPPCDYVVSFAGKSAAEGQLFEIADYDVRWSCRGPIEFLTPMFITEAPYQMGQKKVFQISVDILELDDGFEEVFSTTVFYDKSKGEVRFDSVSSKKYGRASAAGKVRADGVEAALKAAVKLAHAAWNKTVWRELAKKGKP